RRTSSRAPRPPARGPRWPGGLGMTTKQRRPGEMARGDEAGIQPSDHSGEPPNSTAPAEPGDPSTLAEVLAELPRTLPLLLAATDRQAGRAVDRMALRADELEASLGLSKRLIQKEVSAGRFPRPVKIGRVSVWPVEVVRQFLAQHQAAGRRSHR